MASILRLGVAILALGALAVAAPLGSAATGHVRFFQTPTHNISCELDSGRAGVPDAAYCQTLSPAASATLRATGTLKTCHGTRCLGNPPENDPVLAYGHRIVLGPFRCASRATGVSCVGSAGRGFTISRSGVSSTR
jgi:hypothetical protein